jgi:hypothetical protein
MKLSDEVICSGPPLRPGRRTLNASISGENADG